MSGEDIPLDARTVTLADTFDVLTHDRPYRTAWPADRALAEIRRERGRQFDPNVVDAFLGEFFEPNPRSPTIVAPSPACVKRFEMILRFFRLARIDVNS